MAIDPDVYTEIRTEFPDKDDEAIVDSLVRTFHRSQELLAENERLRDENAVLASRLEETEASVRRLEKDRDSAERYCENLRVRYQKLCAKQENHEPEVVVREKVVVHEDSATIDALREKVSVLKERLWELQRREDEHRGLVDRLRELESRNDDWTRTYHGIILRSKGRKALPDIELAIIDSKDYFKYKRERDGFEQDHHIHGPYLVKELPYDK
jgi:chromosome segregation ATPase